MIVLACNAGSTSLKFKLYKMPESTVLATGKVERVGSADDAIFAYRNCESGFSVSEEGQNIQNYEVGILRFLACLTTGDGAVLSNIEQIERVGYKPVLSRGHLDVHEMNDEVICGMREFYELAPVHTGAYLNAVETVSKVLPKATHIGVFETSFHKTIPLERRIYGIPYEWYEKYGIMRMGFHGASHGYIADALDAEKKEYRAISCHLGGSGSICAILNGKSVDTSFGMSLETGLIHANRVGDMDPTMFHYLQKQGMTDDEIMNGLLKNGGLLGISGVSNDLRYVMEAADGGNERAKLAIDVFVCGIAHYIGAFYIDLGGLDYLVFTAGIGEHSPRLRALVCGKLAALGVKLDPEKN
ncbi:MAG: acetate/propionate family kinase [Clostridiales bacterium]|nr:acetate/propionate family kinase [Clostridiales bacterium]